MPNTKQNLAEEEKKDIREKTASREKITRKTLERTRIQEIIEKHPLKAAEQWKSVRSAL